MVHEEGTLVHEEGTLVHEEGTLVHEEGSLVQLLNRILNTTTVEIDCTESQYKTWIVGITNPGWAGCINSNHDGMQFHLA